MRAFAALVPFALLLAGPAGAVGVGEVGETDSVTLRPRGAPVAVDVNGTGGEDVASDAPLEAAPPVAVPVPDSSATGRRAPYEAPYGYARASWGDEGRVDIADPSSWQADLVLETPAPFTYSKAGLPGVKPQSIHLGLHARAERLAEAREVRLERALAAGHALPRAPAGPAAPSLGFPPASREVALEYHAPAPRAYPASGAPAAPGAPGAPEVLATRVDAAPTTPWAHVATLAAGAALLLLLPWTLYHRLRGAQVLDQDTRGRLFQVVQASPGLAAADLARALDIDPKTARYHLDRLVRERLAVADGPRRSLRYFAVGSVAPELRARLVAAREGREVLDAVRAAPGATKGALAAALAIARPTLAWHLGRLERAGLVRCERAGRESRVYADEEALASLGGGAPSAKTT